MELPVDPNDDHSPAAVIQSLPNRRAFRRVLDVSEVDVELGDDDEIDAIIRDLDPVERRTMASQIRFAAFQSVFYYHVPSIRSLSDADLEAVDDASHSGGVYGPEVRSVHRAHDRVYILCSVPEKANQTTLGMDEEARQTAVVTFDTDSELLSVRAWSVDAADGARSAVSDQIGLSGGTRVSPRTLHEQFAADAVTAYTQLELTPTNWRDPSGPTATRIEISTDREDDGPNDIRQDDFVQDLIERDDLKYTSARAIIELSEELSIRLWFDDAHIEFYQFVPEQTYIALDRAIESALNT